MPPSLNSFWGRRPSQESLRPRSTASGTSAAPSLPPYTVEPFLLSPIFDCPNTPDTLVPTNFTTHANRGGKISHRTTESIPRLHVSNLDVEDTERGPAAAQFGPTDGFGPHLSTTDLRATHSSLDLNTQNQTSEPDQPTLISEALKAGEGIYALHHRTLYDQKGGKNDTVTHARLQSVYLGELVYHVKHYFTLVRKSRGMAERVQRNHVDRALQLCSKLRSKEITIPQFWVSMITLVNETQRILSNRHLDLGVGALAASLSEIELSLATKRSGQNLRPSNVTGPSDTGPSGTNIAGSSSAGSSGSSSSAAGRGRRPSRDQPNAWSDIEWIYLFG